MSGILQRRDNLAYSTPEPFTPWQTQPTGGTALPGTARVCVYYDEALLFHLLSSSDAWIRHLAQAIGEARRQLDVMMAERAELETAEVFSLSPLSRRRVIAKVRKAEPARFYLVLDNDGDVENEED